MDKPHGAPCVLATTRTQWPFWLLGIEGSDALVEFVIVGSPRSPCTWYKWVGSVESCLLL